MAVLLLLLQLCERLGQVVQMFIFWCIFDCRLAAQAKAGWLAGRPQNLRNECALARSGCSRVSSSLDYLFLAKIAHFPMLLLSLLLLLLLLQLLLLSLRRRV